MSTAGGVLEGQMPLPLFMTNHAAAAAEPSFLPAVVPDAQCEAMALQDWFKAIDSTLALLGTLGEDDAELRADLEAGLQNAITGTREKIDRTNYVFVALEAGDAAADREIERLQKRKERFSKQRAQLEGYVVYALNSAGVKKFEGETCTFSIHKDPPKLLIDEGAVIPAEYMRTPAPPPPPPPPVAVPDKNAIKKFLKGKGAFLAGCRLSETYKLVRE